MKRITADFSPEAYEVLGKIANDLNTTKADALRRVIGLTDFLLTEKKQGWTIQLEKGNSTKEIIHI